MTRRLLITKRQAIADCKELWADIAASGLDKADYLFSAEGRAKWGKRLTVPYCPLCTYDLQFQQGDYASCKRCPLEAQYGQNCYDLGYNGASLPTAAWLSAIQGLR